MTQPIFLRTRHEYDSYSDFWRLVNLSNYTVYFVDEVTLHNKEHVYIVSPMTGEFDRLDWSKGKSCTIIHWNLERPCDGTLQEYIDANNRFHVSGKVDVTVVSDKRLAEQSGFHYVPLGGHQDFGEPGTVKKYDFIHLMAYNYRRSQTGLFNYITPKTKFDGHTIAPNGWGIARDKALKASRFMLNVHQDKHPYIEPVRFMIASMYELPIVSEKVLDPYPYENLLQFTLNTMSAKLDEVAFNYGRFKQLGVDNREMMINEFSFRNCVEKYL